MEPHQKQAGATIDGLKALTICVGYDDILALTMPRNARHFSTYLIVTSHEDDRTARLVEETPGVDLFCTDAFTRNGAVFNKGLAIEEGFDILDRSGWILLLDADIVLPEVLEPGPLNPEALYGMLRRQLPEGLLDLGGDWTFWPVMDDWPFPGYFQLFHADARALRQRPWYTSRSGHAGVSDARFSVIGWYWKAPYCTSGVPVKTGLAGSRRDSTVCPCRMRMCSRR